jgi:hypothetical protein
MAKGKRLSSGLGDTWTVPFYVNADGANSKTFGAAAETVLAAHFVNVGDGSSLTHVVVPFPCEIERVVMQGQGAAIADQIRVRVRRHLFTAGDTSVAAGVDVISNANTAATTTIVDYVRAIATTGDGYVLIDYKGEPEAGTNTSSKGFSETVIAGAPAGLTLRKQFAPGDEITATAQCPTSDDNFSHIQVYAVFNRLD